MIVESSRISSQRANARLLLDYTSFCLKNDAAPGVVDVDGKHLNVEAVCLWFLDRTDRMGGCNSMPSWSATLTWYCLAWGSRFIPGRIDRPPSPYYQCHPRFRETRKLLVQTSLTESKNKVLIPFRYLLLFMIECLHIDPDDIQSVAYDDLIEAAFLAMYWNTICRPGVIFAKDLTDPDSEFLKITGVHWDQIQIIHGSEFHRNEATRVRIPHYKNQPPPKVPKDVTFGSVLCGKHKTKCACPYWHVPMYLREIKRRRSNRFADPTLVGCDRLTLDPKQSVNLGVDGRNFVLVTSRGTVFGSSHCSKVFKRMNAFLGIDKEKLNITPYCLRVTATSIAHHQGIDPLLLMRYVIWACNKKANPSIHARYIAFTLAQLAAVPYQILHGLKSSAGITVNRLYHNEVQIYDINAKSTEYAMYGRCKKNTSTK